MLYFLYRICIDTKKKLRYEWINEYDMTHYAWTFFFSSYHCSCVRACIFTHNNNSNNNMNLFGYFSFVWFGLFVRLFAVGHALRVTAYCFLHMAVVYLHIFFYTCTNVWIFIQFTFFFVRKLLLLTMFSSY